MADDTETRELANALRWSPGWSDALPEGQRPIASARYILGSSWLAARDAAVAERALAPIRALADHLDGYNPSHGDYATAARMIRAAIRGAS